MSRSLPLPRVFSSLRQSRACPIHGRRHVAFLPRNNQWQSVRGVHQFTTGDLKQLLPTMEELGLQRGDHVTVAMSGGVDSSVTLRILSEMPINIEVVYMRNWDPLLSESSSSDTDSPSSLSLSYPSDPSSSRQPNLSPCAWEKDWNDVRAVAKHVGIPPDRVRLIDLSKEYWSEVFEPAVRIWERGETPNPDVECNRKIKFGALMQHIPRGRGRFLATGHYARIKRVPHAIRLCRAKDMSKDQSYYLSSITEDQMKKAILPLGDITKPWVRKLAEFWGLPTAEREESMGLCFVGERGNFGDFVSQYVTPPSTQGYFIDETGTRSAPHKGLWYYTIGQGAKLSGQPESLYIAKKGLGESQQDILVVPGQEHPKLLCTQLITDDFHWIAAKVPKGIVPGGVKKAYVQLRHRMEPVTGILSHDWHGPGLQIDFPEPIPGVAPGQVAAIYYQKWCLGSGIIRSTRTADELPATSWKERKESQREERGAVKRDAMERQRAFSGREKSRREVVRGLERDWEVRMGVGGRKVGGERKVIDGNDGRLMDEKELLGGEGNQSGVI